ncbi:MAG: sugar-binding protein [Spirochaetes bacterium]|nr:sugar-binding protein [Spirochaetota bacterium]MBN2769878.1 sugar-binding protein [Spirochaetota bacterium]
MKRIVKFVTALITLALIVSVASCGKNSGKKIVGIAMPTQSSQRWIQDGGNMKKILEDRGYQVDLQYAEDSIDAQVAQLENMITKGADCLVIASIDGETLTNTLQKAADAKIPVIAYDRLIRNSEHVSYYATFDNFLVGVQQGGYIVDKLGLADGKGPFNIEIFAGSPDDNNAYFFFNGAMSKLQPYIDSKMLVVKSGQIEFDKVATLRWDGATAQQRMDNILTAHYTSSNVDAILSPYDGISIGILSSLKSVGYGSGSKKLPIVTGQDAELPSVKSMIAGEQTQTVFKDTRTLAKRAADMVDSVLKGEDAEVNDTKTYDNGIKVVPSYLESPVSVDINNYKEALIDTGYYTEDQLK